MSNTGSGGSTRGRPPKEQTERKRREMTARMRAFVVWKSTPFAERQIKTQHEFAEALGVSDQAVWQWSKDPRVVEAVKFMTLQNASEPDKVRTILDMLHNQAVERQDSRIAEIWLKATGVMSAWGRQSEMMDMIVDELDESVELKELTQEDLVAMRELAAAEKAEEAAILAARASQSPLQG